MKLFFSRRIRNLVLFILLTTEMSLASARRPFAQGARPLVTEVAAVGMTVADMERSIDFYSHVLSFRKLSESDQDSNEYQELENVPGAKTKTVRMQLGGAVIELVQYSAPRGKLVPPDSKSNDLWFQHVAIVVSDMQKAYALLEQNQVRGISDGPQRLPRWNKEAADIEAYYFKDPDGHPLELIHFPEGKGDRKWQEKGKGLFLGIDHTAIAASSTDESLRFYGLLGFQERGHSLNYGIEQDRLSGVREARVRITSLRPSSGPGIELLDYQNPRTGRPAPPDERANDLVHHQTLLVTPDLRGVIEKLCAARIIFVSAGGSCDAPATWESRHRVLVRDPDGHVMELVEK
jgi:catechol 2,3-dioxygenase-like lactoylglutathione lyase family enzyme